MHQIDAEIVEEEVEQRQFGHTKQKLKSPLCLIVEECVSLFIKNLNPYSKNNTLP